MSVVVTGGSGRLGRSVVDVLAAHGHDVVSVDRAPRPDLVERVREVVVDLQDAAAFRALLTEVGADTIVHLAAIAVPFSAPDDVIFDTNVGLADLVFSAAVDTGVARVLVASSPTVLGYGDPAGWQPAYLPLDEEHPVHGWNGYARSKVEIERLVRERAAQHTGIRFGAFRPCYVIAPEEWRGAPTQQGHTVIERLDDPSLASVALFNYVDARDAGEFVAAWMTRAHEVENGSVYFVSAEDAFSRESLDVALPRLVPAAGSHAAALTGGVAAFSTAKARRELGWHPTRSWRTEIELPDTAATPAAV
jgi:UDP-glucose 4-epimerase